MKDKFIWIGVILALVFSGIGFVSQPDKINVNDAVNQAVKKLGAQPGPDYTELQYFRGGYTLGGNSCFATSTTAAVGTLPNLANEVNCVDYTVNQADVTLTLAASTSAWYPSKRNELRSLFIRNATTTATGDIILAAGTGINLKRATSSVTILGDTGADNYARIDFVRQADSDLNAFVTLFID